MLMTKSVIDFLNEVASDSPAPGGGSVAALSGALGVALTSMVCRLTIGKKKYAEVQQEMEETLKRAEELRSRFSDLIQKDTEAFNAVMRAFGMPKETEEEKRARSAAIQETMKQATLVPLEVMELCTLALPLAKTVAEKGNVNSISDAGVSALMLEAAWAGAALNVRINLQTLEDTTFVEETKAKLGELQTKVESLRGELFASRTAKL